MKRLAWLLMPVLCLAVPSDWDEVKTFTQPDGYQFEGRLIGDEHFHFVEDLEGHVMMRNVEGWWTYADKEDGLLVPTQFVVGHSIPPFARGLRPSAEAVAAMENNRFKIINQHHNLVQANEDKAKVKEQLLERDVTWEELMDIMGISAGQAVVILLARFSDMGFSSTYSGPNARGHFLYMMFGCDSTASNNYNNFYVDTLRNGSVTNYFYEASYAKCWMGTAGTVGPCGSNATPGVDTIRTLSNPWDYYGRNNRPSICMQASADDCRDNIYIQHAIAAANNYVNFAAYDLDSDGRVDGVVVIHPGMGEEESGEANDMWSKSFSGLSYSADGKTIDKAVIVPENGQIGVFCHELFHQQASAPDLYDYDYDGDPVGDFCLMGGGSWNGSPGGSRPAHMCGLLKYDCDGSWGQGSGGVAGWLGPAAVKEPTELTINGKYYITQFDSTYGSTLDHERFYILPQYGLPSYECFLLENRQRTGYYESNLPREGICIYHLDKNETTTRYNNGPTSANYYRIFQETPGYDPNWFYYLSTFGGLDTVKYSPQDNMRTYASDYGTIVFDRSSTPNCGENTNDNGTPATWGPNITGISSSAYNMYFNVKVSDVTTGVPAIKCYSFAIKDPVTGGYNNNNNNMFNSGEFDTLVLTFYNSGGSANSVQESLYTTDPYVTVVNPHRRNLGTVSHNAYDNDQADPYHIRVAFNAPPYHRATFNYKVWATGYSDTGSVIIMVNPADVVWRFRPADVTHRSFKPMAIAVYKDTIFISDGDSLPPLSGSWRLYRFRSDGTLISSAAHPGASYVGSCDIAPSGNIYWSVADQCYQTTRTFTNVNNFTHDNVNWGSLRRVRGVSFAPTNAPTGYGIGEDSMFVYWHVYDPDYEESLKVESTPTSGTAAFVDSWVIPEGEEGAMDHWRNGRGMEHDGWRIWRVCLFTNEIYRGRAPVSGSTPIDTLFSMANPAYWGAYPGYDIDFQAKAADNSEPHAPYKRGNKFYLWTVNIESADVMKVDVTPIVLPSPVEDVFAVRTGSNNLVIWDEKNYSTNPDTLEKVERYIIYRTDNPTSLGDSIGYINARTAYAADTFTDYNPTRWTVYYRVSAVNWFGFIPGHSNLTNSLIGAEDTPATPISRFFFYQINPTITGRAVTLDYETPQKAQVALKVYNSMGALVRTLVCGEVQPGRYAMVWDLKDERERVLPNGVYFFSCKIEDKYERVQKVILMR